MTQENSNRKTTYLLAWLGEIDGSPQAFFEVQTGHMFRNQSVVSAGISRKGDTVVAFCDYIHGDDVLTKDELRLVAKAYLDDDFKVTKIDFRH